jgi:hypothetical protein
MLQQVKQNVEDLWLYRQQLHVSAQLTSGGVKKKLSECEQQGEAS